MKLTYAYTQYVVLHILKVLGLWVTPGQVWEGSRAGFAHLVAASMKAG